MMLHLVFSSVLFSSRVKRSWMLSSHNVELTNMNLQRASTAAFWTRWQGYSWGEEQMCLRRGAKRAKYPVPVTISRYRTFGRSEVTRVPPLTKL